MSAFSTFLRPLPATRRTYSVFSKPGGGRYFNSAKPLQATNKKVDASSNANTETQSSSDPTEDSSTAPPGQSVNDAKSSIVTPSLGVGFAPFHSPVNPHDLKLHQFFSLHRPLLNIGQPGITIFDPLPSSFTFPPETDAETAKSGSLEDPPEASLESDADAARQLARAMVTNRISAALSWEQTLQRLGLNETKGRAEEVSAAQAEFDAYMDSTKRKRRRKMKKHKLKKRRRLTRMQEENRGRK
ncbi:uncharacterized protein PHACADRAFT_173269 [Phanerochaete carnosa HHB-10118-sp]|uniref:Small ribosomal subunit protein mS38 n=1 Tax=Phanerochaete carnosa (strain HHB-10118-sp) TaxID=650164 RepID=K5UYG1_PHACS|nr:uncharacterized protein PHACADRAFT_173269 [Phanerochaete carnosa HHB-10118-sp]EKM55181.1 hypothetical protein PHACADRAFT_173269 [Phanerochaete carnosa HHB-10118-sp]